VSRSRLEGGEDLGEVGGADRHVGVGRDDVGTACERDAQAHRGALALVDRLLDEEGVGQVAVDGVGGAHRGIGRAVIDDDHLGPVDAELLKHRRQALQAGGEPVLLVEGRHDNRRGDVGGVRWGVRFGHWVQT
jgi:hypothetical protein